MLILHILHIITTCYCLAGLAECNGVQIHRYAQEHLYTHSTTHIKCEQYVGSTISIFLIERCLLLLIYGIEPMWTCLSLFPSLQQNLASVQTAEVCILVGDFGHDGGQFELHQHSLYISPNLLVIRKHLGWICSVVFGHTWTPHMKSKKIWWSISLRLPVSMQ